MKKNGLKNAISIILMVVLSGLSGFFLGVYILPVLIDNPLSLMLILVLAYFIQIIIHEGGHLVFGLLSGYRYSSFRIGSMILLKTSKGYSIRKMKLAGTLGQCIMVPPELKDGRMPVMLYNLGGVILNVISAIISLSLLQIDSLPPIISSFLIVSIVIALFIALTNGIPINSSMVSNDGYNALSLRKDKKATRAFWIQFMINRYLTEDIRLKDMPSDWFEMPEEEDMTNNLISSLAVYKENRLMDQECFDEADNLALKLIDGSYNIPDVYKYLLVADRIYIECINEAREEAINALMDRKYRSFEKTMKDFPSIIRTRYALALCEGSAEKAEIIRQKFRKIKKSYPTIADIKSEEALMDIAEERTKDRVTRDNNPEDL